MKKYIFITHSSHDGEKAKKVRDHLESNGIQCWMAPRDIPVGAEWAEAILDGIENASGMLLVFSSNSNDSSQVRREIERAIHNDLPVFPVRIENVVPSKAMEYYISSNHWMDAFGGDFENNLKNLVDAIKAKAGFTDSKDLDPISKPVQSKEQSPTPTSQVTDKSSKRKLTFPRFSFIIPKKILFPVAFLLLLLAGYFISKSFENSNLDTTIAEVIAPLSAEKDFFLKVISENGVELICTSIEQTLDGGFLITGQRLPEDTTEVWREVWINKLDPSGNLEWEFTDCDTMNVFPLNRTLAFYNKFTLQAIEMPDSTIVCAYSKALVDTILPHRQMTFPWERDLLGEWEDTGVGFNLVHFSKYGDILSNSQLYCQRGAWEVCIISNLLRNDIGGVCVLIRLCNYQFPGNASVLLYIDDFYNIELGELYQRPLQNGIIDAMRIDNFRVVYGQSNTYDGFAYIHEINLETPLPDMLRSPEKVYTLGVGGGYWRDFLFPLEPQYIGRDNVLCYSYQLLRGTGSILKVSLFDNTGNTIYEIALEGIYDSHINDLVLLDSGEMAYCGATTDSTGIGRPYIGLVDRYGEHLWELILPIEGAAKHLLELDNGNLLFAINRSSDIVLLEVNLFGSYHLRALEDNRYQFLEDWSATSIDSTVWDTSYWSVGLVEMLDRGNVLKLVPGPLSLTPEISFKEVLLLEPETEIFTDLFIPNPLSYPAFTQFGLFAFNEDTNNSEGNIAIADFKWNFGPEARSIICSSYDYESLSFPDTQYVKYGEWNRFCISVDSLSVNYFINDEYVCGNNVSESLFGQKTYYQVYGISDIPFFIDSVAICN